MARGLNFVADGDINPWRVVVHDGTVDSRVVEASAVTEAAIGITTGDTRDNTSSLHAAAGDPVRLQNSNFGDVVIATAGEVIAAGDVCYLDGVGGGRAFGATTGDGEVQTTLGIAKTGAASENELFELIWQPDTVIDEIA